MSSISKKARLIVRNRERLDAFKTTSAQGMPNSHHSPSKREFTSELVLYPSSDVPGRLLARYPIAYTKDDEDENQVGTGKLAFFAKDKRLDFFTWRTESPEMSQLAIRYGFL